MTEPEADKKSHLPSKRRQMQQRGRVRAQAPGETQQKVEKTKEKQIKKGRQ